MFYWLTSLTERNKLIDSCINGNYAIVFKKRKIYAKSDIHL